ncbi:MULTISPECIES: response regulator transcription factor [unclassified Leptolyngbya]|uniref:response regulator transcription factor n=1 Tax=unclassified Leptolyngbya TaxID=2650499 RepID=UPI001689DBFB|nr:MULTISPECIES: response regulator transcription factor [unclassified Leptolyngbya]MBD1911314.1 response regulator transcription factor [Leptolyngbya sp. FACHB-8]MBD2156668.1 response regulator transcription factor [Leptolyngbya sp. FACHB-16]
MKILLVEDDTRIARALAEALTDQQYAVDIATDGEEGWDMAEAYQYSLILLDWMLPKLDGIQLCQRLRQRGIQTPVLILTARDTNTDTVIGLDAGADDYVVKPFDLKALMARIRALLRRSSSTLPPILEWGGLHLDPGSLEVWYGDRPLTLTPKEYQLLELFLRQSHRTLSRSSILEQLWASETTPGEETVKVHIRSLRQKLAAAGAPDFIETVYGLGYRLKPAGQDSGS